MIKYILEDGFQFVTDDKDLIVRTRYSGDTDYRTEEGLDIRVIGSVPVEEVDLDDRTNIPIANVSYPALVVEYLVIKGELAQPTASPTKIGSIDYKPGLAKRIADFLRKVSE